MAEASARMKSDSYSYEWVRAAHGRYPSGCHHDDDIEGARWREVGDKALRLEMPDGTAVLLSIDDRGMIIATQAPRLPDGKLPKPSGFVYHSTAPEDRALFASFIEFTGAKNE